MALDRSTLSLGYGEELVFPPERSILRRMPSTLWKFTRRKPLGAFGALLVFVLCLMALGGGGLSQVGIKIPSLYETVFGAVGLPHYGYNAYVLGKHKLEGPSWQHWFGTDQLGRDVFSRIMYGAGVSIYLGIGVLIISTALSTSLTLISGYYVTTVDLVLQRVVEIFHVVPQFILIIALFGIYGGTPTTLLLTLGILGGFSTSRILRSLVIGIRGQPYIEATKSIGASDMRILMRHVLPNVFYLIIVSATGAVSAVIATEAGLAIIGIGLDPTFPTWGNLLNASREQLRVAPWLALAPAGVLAMSIFGFRLLGDALRDVLDPRLRGSR
jgi:peptide/nickel transport system permease protein